MNLQLAAANALLILHVLVIAFITLSLPAIWWGAYRRKRWARARLFRYLHLAAISYVVGETWLGIACPLTQWEAALRGRGTDVTVGFIPYWIHRLLFYSLPPADFLWAYSGFGLAVLLTWMWVPPGPPRGD